MSNDDREETIRTLFPLVRSSARRVLRVVAAADFDDLIGDGSIGLIRAVDTFDAERGTSLELYARRLIVGAMLNGLRRCDPVSERVRRTLRRAEAERYALAQERGTLPSLAELARDDARLRRARVAAYEQNAISIDAPSASARRAVTDPSADPAELAVSRAKSHAIAEAVALLPERQQRVVALHYTNDLTLHAISASLRISPQRVSQLHLAAIRTLRSTVPNA